MNSVKVAILDEAERRMRIGGFSSFSFREIAAEIGVKSSSVHYHFTTKEDLAVAVVRRYTETAAAAFEERLQSGADPVEVWTDAFRNTLHSDHGMCPCAVLGAAAPDLPAAVAAEVKKFFAMCLDKLTSGGLPADDAAEVLSTLTGALVLARALRDDAAFDRATTALRRRQGGAGLHRALS